MPEGKHKSRTLRRVFVRTPGKKNKVHYRPRKMDKKVCAQCGKHLHGIPHVTHVEFKNLAKTKKKPQRPYGGVLCSACMRKKIIEQVM